MGRVGEARNGLGSAALTMFFPIEFSKDGTIGTLLLWQRRCIHRCHSFYFGLSRDLILSVTRLEVVRSPRRPRKAREATLRSVYTRKPTQPYSQ